ncbi:MAG: NnrS family protein [Acetobacteraceae bacterium]|nr:NnrS family protein [Acetobacteraceae bacterium]
MSSAARLSSGRMPAVLSHGFRLFFFAAALWSAVALALWLGMYVHGAALPSRFAPLAWHSHEMLFGFVMAAIAGFLLTAIPNWTHRLPVSGWPLLLLFGCWLLGRVACTVSALIPAWLSIVVDLAFPVALVAVAAREIVAGRNWRNLPMIVPISVLGVANLLMHLEAAEVAVPPGTGWRLGLAGVLILISIVGGRIVPSFTRNWLAKRPGAALPGTVGWIDRLAVATLLAGLLFWAFLPDSRVVGLLLLLAAFVNLARLLRWRGWATFAEPLLLILHVGYGWLVIGTALLGATVLDADLPQAAAIHALTAGAAATMILAVMTRATRGHTGRDLTADRTTTLLYVLLTGAAVTRVVAGFGVGPILPLLVVSGGLWIAAFAGFALAYGPMLLLPRPRR